MQKQKSLKLNAILNMIRTLMGVIFPLITFPYSSRVLGPEGIGKVNFANSIIAYFSIISGLGIANYATREAAKLRDNRIELSKFSKEIFLINSTSTLIAYILFFISIFIVPKFENYRLLLCICSFTILFNTIGIAWLYTAVEDYFYITLRTIIFQIFSMILLFTTVKTLDDIFEYAGLMVLSSVGANVLNFIHSKKYIDFFQKAKIELKKHLRPIFVLFAMTVAVSVYTILDTSMLGFLTDDREVGIYTAATKINKIVLSMVTAMTAVLLPRLSYYAKLEDKSQFNELVYKGFYVLLLISLPCTVGLSILSKTIITLLSGTTFISAVTTMRIINPIIVIIGLSGFIGTQIFLPLNKEKLTLYSVIPGAMVNFTLNLILIPYLGANGAALSTLIAEFVVTAIQIFFLRKMYNLSIIAKLFFKYSVFSFIMAIPVILISKHFLNMYVAITLGTVVGALIYILLLLITKDKILYAFLSGISKKIKNNNANKPKER